MVRVEVRRQGKWDFVFRRLEASVSHDEAVEHEQSYGRRQVFEERAFTTAGQLSLSFGRLTHS